MYTREFQTVLSTKETERNKAVWGGRGIRDEAGETMKKGYLRNGDREWTFKEGTSEKKQGREKTAVET